MSFSVDKKPKEVIKIYGTDYEVGRLSVQQVVDFSAKAKQEGANEAEETIKMMASMGLPEQVIKSLDADDFQALAEYLFKPKKK